MSGEKTQVNALSIDLEDWFQGLTSTNRMPERWPRLETRVEANAERLLALLEEYHVRATFFVLGYVADACPDLVERVVAAGHEIGVHGYWHRPVHRLTPEEFAAELDSSLDVLHRLVDCPIIGYRAPYFSINKDSLWALDVLREKGFRYDSSFFPTRNMLYGYPGGPRFPHRPGGDDLVEFPISTARWVGINWPIGGGFYLRTWPYPLIRLGIRQLSRLSQPAIMYLHPWELDLQQPRPRVTPRERITHYCRRGGLEGKLRRLLQDFQFVALSDLLDRITQEGRVH
jgi:polysaccharide deacetylase family protein (PEP-CTERM system associated)